MPSTPPKPSRPPKPRARTWPRSIHSSGSKSLRQQLERLSTYKTDGHPFTMGLGLYAGDDLYPHVRAAYYTRFAQLLFRQAQTALVTHLNGLPVAPGASDDYSLTYDILKGYLITTAASDKTSDASPAPILLARWAEGRNPDSARMQLADKQFRFYARDLKNGNPFSPNADTTAVGRGRAYLAQFSGIERVYQFMLSSAGKKSANFNRDVANSAGAVLNNRDVPGAFTKAGYTWMQDALRGADKFFAGERWVLCDATGNVPATNCVSGNIDAGKLTQDLSARYVSDFIAQWRNYFKATNVLRYSDLKDASRKLNLEAGPQSPILGLFWLASQNVGVDYTKIPGADKIGKAFQSVLAIVPAESGRPLCLSGQPAVSFGARTTAGLHRCRSQYAHAGPCHCLKHAEQRNVGPGRFAPGGAELQHRPGGAPRTDRAAPARRAHHQCRSAPPRSRPERTQQ